MLGPSEVHADDGGLPGAARSTLAGLGLRDALLGASPNAECRRPRILATIREPHGITLTRPLTPTSDTHQ